MDIWEQQLNLSWAEFPDSSSLNHDSGPHLSRLPEELLPAITKFMYVAKDDLDKVIVNYMIFIFTQIKVLYSVICLG